MEVFVLSLVLMGVAVLAMALEAVRQARPSWREPLLRLSAGFAGTWIVWAGVSVALGFADDLLATYATFFELAAEQPKVWPSLPNGLGRDSGRSPWTQSSSSRPSTEPL